MKSEVRNSKSEVNPKFEARIQSRQGAFTLIELLVVIAIIGILAAIAMPTLTMFKPNPLAAASRQLLDDLAFARHKALADHTTVYVVFMPAKENLDQNFSQWSSPNLPGTLGGINSIIQQRMLKAQYSGYALYERRQIGDQPGQKRAHWLTNWRTLPKGTFIAPQKFGPNNVVAPQRTKLTGYWPFDFMTFNYGTSTDPNADDGPFLTDPENPNHATSYSRMPFIAFDYRGSLLQPWESWRGPDPDHPNAPTNNVADCVIPLTQGVVNSSTNYLAPAPLTYSENPRNGWTNIPGFNLVVIDGPTGRARVERRQLQ